MAALLALWLVFVAGEISSLWFGVPAAAAAAGVSLVLLPPGRRWQWLRIVSLAAFFVEYSLRGGFDVARRALDPRQPLAPAFVDFELRLPPGRASVLFIDIASLLPGTLSTELRGTTLHLHVLDVRTPMEPVLRALERRVAGLLGVDLPAAEGEAR